MVQTDMIRQEFSKRLITALNEANYPAHGRGIRLARELGVSSKAVSKWLSGESLPRPALLYSLAKTLRVEPLWLQHGDVVREVEERLMSTIFRGSFPLINWSNVDDWKTYIYDNRHKLDRFASGSSIEESFAFWLMINDDTMTSPSGISVPKDSMILVDAHRSPEHGDLVIAKLSGAKVATFKQLIIDDGTLKRYLKPLNINYKPLEIDESCQFFGVAVESRMGLVTPDLADASYRD